jgi:hypothetical protein
MNFLLLYIDKGKTFDREHFLQLLQSIDGICEIEESCSDGACIRGRYNYGGDSTIVELKEDLESIVLSGLGNSAIDLAFRIQQYCFEPLHIIDSDYSFDLIVSDFKDASEFRMTILSSLGE